MEIYIDKYLDHLIRLKAVSREYARIVKSRLGDIMLFLKELRIENIQDIRCKHLIKYQEIIIKRDISASTKRDELLTIARFFKFLHDYEYIKENPALAIDPPKKPRHLPRNILGEQEIAYLLRQPEKNDLIGVRDFCIMGLLYSSMMRTKEIFSLKLDDIDLRLK